MISRHWKGVAKREGSIAMPVGALADPKFPSPTFSVYEERMHSWVSMPPGVEHMAWANRDA
jgi:hypothetical protein